MGEFISVIIDQDKCGDIEEVATWVQVCPVSIFEIKNGIPVVIEDNEDECTLCGRCLTACETGTIVIKKHYEQ